MPDILTSKYIGNQVRPFCASSFICYKLNKNNLNYKQRLLFLNIESLRNRRIKQFLKVLFKIKFKISSIPYDWFDLMQFIDT